jgi:hypothetical protein
MTVVAVWRTNDRLMAVADTRIIRDPGNILTEHGPKLLPISIACKQPGPQGFFDKEIFRANVGFAYSGATLSALAAHALASTLLTKLIGPPKAPPPSLREIATFVAGASAEYMHDVGQLAGKGGLFSAIVFGWCPQKKDLQTFQLHPEIGGTHFQVKVDERVLTPIKVGGSAAQSVILIGSSIDWLTNAIDADLAAAKKINANQIAVRDAPKHALRSLISQGIDAAVGGSIQQGWATALGFEIAANMEPITPKPPSTRNAGLFLLGFDTFDIQTVGNYRVASEGL